MTADSGSTRMRDFADKVAVVTGAASGIGLALATLFGQRGMKVVLADIEQPALDKAVEDLCKQGLLVTGVRTDVSDAESVEALARETLRLHGKVHVLCNNAGVGSAAFAPVWRATPKEWQWILGVNLWGAIHGLRSFAQPMLDHGEEGRIINTASVWGVVSGAHPHGVSKHALVALSEALHGDLRRAQARIGVSVLLPGPVQTNLPDSGRNRPPELRDEPDGARPESELVAALGGMRGLARVGIPPGDVAQRVLAAIENDVFWIFTHDGFDAAIESRTADIIARRNPSQDARTAGWKPRDRI